MKTLVVFYSRTGNTRMVAGEIAKQLKADTDEITDKADRSGAKGWILAGRDASRKSLADIESKKDPAKYDLVIIGTPIWAFTVTPAIRTYFTKNKELSKVAFFLTSGGKGIEHTFKEMEKLSKKPLATLAIKANTWTSKIDFAKERAAERIEYFCKSVKKST